MKVRVNGSPVEPCEVVLMVDTRVGLDLAVADREELFFIAKTWRIYASNRDSTEKLRELLEREAGTEDISGMEVNIYRLHCCTCHEDLVKHIESCAPSVVTKKTHNSVAFQALYKQAEERELWHQAHIIMQRAAESSGDE